MAAALGGCVVQHWTIKLYADSFEAQEGIMTGIPRSIHEMYAMKWWWVVFLGLYKRKERDLRWMSHYARNPEVQPLSLIAAACLKPDPAHAMHERGSRGRFAVSLARSLATCMNILIISRAFSNCKADFDSESSVMGTISGQKWSSNLNSRDVEAVILGSPCLESQD
jgi:hypothetical protein